MTDVSLQMLYGDRAKYALLITGVCFSTILMAQGWPHPEILAETTRVEGPLGWIGAQGDPFFAVIANQPEP